MHAFERALGWLARTQKDVREVWCGDVAAAVEEECAAFEPVTARGAGLLDVVRASAGTNAVFQLQVTFDSDTLSDDHVAFFTPVGRTCILVMHAYARAYGPTLQLLPLSWLQDVENMCAARDADAWMALFSLEGTPGAQFVRHHLTSGNLTTELVYVGKARARRLR